ncbi:ChaN family lipoprotein [Aerosakkonema funiforme]|uniref:ChaN family lipoprotein n=1 Tax=Aerosakkonema funiforme TaxID=1246630 RepID=UPI0035B6D888
MRKCQFVSLCALSLGIILFCTQLVNAQRVLPPRQLPTYTSQTVLSQLAQANVVYLGETHDNPEDHIIQLQIIEELHRQNPNIAIAMEMFQRPFQFELDRYIGNELTEVRLRERTDYENRWGFPWEYYAPILRFAKANRLPVLALNTPTEITRKVARRGLESLSREEQQYIPPLSEIRTDNAAYRVLMLQIYEQMHQGSGSSSSFERFFQAQVLWDETMAEVIAQFLQRNPDFQVVTLVGQGHVVYGYGIPSRVARRLGSANLVQRVVLLNPPDSSQFKADKSIADFIWRTTLD